MTLKLENLIKRKLKELKRLQKILSKRITIRLYDHDHKGIKKKTMEKGIPYQTLISGVIHQYVEGELKEK